MVDKLRVAALDGGGICGGGGGGEKPKEKQTKKRVIFIIKGRECRKQIGEGEIHEEHTHRRRRRTNLILFGSTTNIEYHFDTTANNCRHRSYH